MTLAQAREYLNNKHDFVVSVKTMYNWTTTGRKGTTLQISTKRGITYTRKEYIDAFVHAFH